MHAALQIHGQSSDDSDGENGEPTYYVVTMPWRAPEVLKRYQWVNPRNNTETVHGKRRSGAIPRKRVRSRIQKASSRPAPAGLPQNLYNNDWYTALSARQKRDLDAKPAIKFMTSPDLDRM